MAFFTYSELRADSVRLLKIHSPESSKTFPSRLELVHVLDTDLDNTRYEAVSYVWGPPKQGKPVTFIDNNHLMITDTLDEALSRLIAVSTTGLLWIDQLCIDQRNNEEKSRQVPKMGLIYTHAERTLAWLGSTPAANTQFSSLVPALHQELDTWIKIHGEDPLLECPDDPNTYVPAFDLLRHIIHNRRTFNKSNWGAIFQALRGLGFESKTGNWSLGHWAELVGGKLWRPYRMSGGIKEYHITPAYDRIRTDRDLDNKTEKTDSEELEILAREDSVMFYCYRAVLNIGTILAKGENQNLAQSLDMIIKNLGPLLEHALGHPWCTRVWIMQEAKLSKNLEFLLNDEIFQPRDLLRLHNLLQFCHSVNNDTVSEVEGLHEARWSHILTKDHDYRDPLSTYLSRRMAHTPISIEEASDARDMVYGLLPVCKSEPYLPAINYDLSIPQVYAATTRYFLARYHSLWVLQFCNHFYTMTVGHKGSGRTDLPSWVPDWSSYPLVKPLSSTYFPTIFSGVNRCKTHNDGREYRCPLCGDGGIPYSAAGQRRYVATEEDSSEVLTIRGKVIDQVMDLVLEPQDFEWGRHLLDILVSTESDDWVESQIDEVFAAIISRAARLRDVTTPLGRRDLLEFLFVTPFLYQPSAFRVHNLSMEDVLRHAEQGDVPLEGFPKVPTLKRYFAALLGRNFAMTDNGFYFGPDVMEIGDQIAIIHGSEFPLVLRPVNNDEQTYALVGQCMVRDNRIMFGDAVDWEEADAQIFKLV